MRSKTLMHRTWVHTVSIFFFFFSPTSTNSVSQKDGLSDMNVPKNDS